MTGGVAGYNLGYIGSCRNSAFVNIESTDPGVDITSIDLDFSMDLTRLSQADTANIATDTGGIAGYSSGTIMDCANLAAIGHQHIGYNVGGIAARMKAAPADERTSAALPDSSSLISAWS